jgi:hypothetical protein
VIEGLGVSFVTKHLYLKYINISSDLISSVLVYFFTIFDLLYGFW